MLPPKLERATGDRESQPPGASRSQVGRCIGRGLIKGWSVGMDGLKTKLWGQSYRVPGLHSKLYLRRPP